MIDLEAIRKRAEAATKGLDRFVPEAPADILDTSWHMTYGYRVREDIPALLSLVEAQAAELSKLRALADEAASVVQRAGRRPDGTTWADLNINTLASKVAALAAWHGKP